MTERPKMRSPRREMLLTGFWVAFLAATIPNTVEAFTDVDGTWWVVVRVVLSSAFTLVLLALIADWASDWLRKLFGRARSSMKPPAAEPDHQDDQAT